MDGTGYMCTINGRDYYKKNEGKALCGVFYYSYSGYTGPIIVSDNEEAVTYYTSYNSEYCFVSSESFEYKGITWYISATDYFWEGDHSSSGFAPKLDGAYYYHADAAKALIDAAGVTVY